MTQEPRYWFKAKRFGWGWGLPLTWQGWLAFGLYFASAVLSLVFLTPARCSRGVFGAVLVGLTLLLVAVCWLKGEPLRWRWGRDDGEE